MKIRLLLALTMLKNILLPILNDTPSTFYFKTRRKIDLFGICNEHSNEQLNFLIDECYKISKGDS